MCPEWPSAFTFVFRLRSSESGSPSPRNASSRTRYCDLHQLPIHETYADDGVSGTVPIEMRPAGMRLLEDARQHKFDQLLVFKLDRLGRDTRLILNAVAELEKHGVRVRA